MLLQDTPVPWGPGTLHAVITIVTRFLFVDKTPGNTFEADQTMLRVLAAVLPVTTCPAKPCSNAAEQCVSFKQS